MPLALPLVLLTAVVILVAVVGVAAGHAGPAMPAPPRIGTPREVDDADVADPFILPVGTGAATTYYLFGTTDWRSNVPTATSSDLVHWTSAPDALPRLPRWATPSISMTWGPAVLAVSGHYVMYVATEEAASGRQCISAAVSAGPGGPYVDTSAAPFVCQRQLGGSIDPTVIESGGVDHLVWKNDGNCCGLPAGIWEQQLTPDGLHLTGPVHHLLAADEPWQQGNIEAPAMVRAAGGGWWLFYSGSSWRASTYATGLAWCPSITGPCRETLDHPFLGTTADARTPGGLETFRDSRGEEWVAFTSTVLEPSRRRHHHHYLNRVLDVAPLNLG
jgi:beta-xylosidase